LLMIRYQQQQVIVQILLAITRSFEKNAQRHYGLVFISSTCC